MENMLEASAGSDMVKLETMARAAKSIPWSESRTGFPVLVRVTAPMQPTQRHSLDLVAVLDTSSSMSKEGRMDFVKQAMEFVIDNLGDEDRLSIVPFRKTDNEGQFCTLTKMLDQKNREKMKALVNKLKPCPWTVEGPDGTNDLEAAEEAAKILRRRTEDEKSTHIGRIIYLSDGSYEVEKVSPDFPVNTFGLGSGHRPETMRKISQQSSGVYSYVNKNLEKIKDAFAQSIGALTTVTAIDLEIKLKTHEGVSISSIESGSYQQSISRDSQEGTIEINDLCAGEKKNFIVYLVIPEGGDDKLMTVSGSYKNLKISKNSIHLGKSQVVVDSPSQEVVHTEVAAELARLHLVKGVSDLKKKNQLDKKNVQSLWDSVNAPEQAMSNLVNDVRALQGEKEVKPFMLSWLTSHLSQRATTKGSPSESCDFQTSAMKNMVRRADNQEHGAQAGAEAGTKAGAGAAAAAGGVLFSKWELLNDKVKTMCRKGVTWAKINPWSCALPSATLLLLAALLITIYVGTHSTNKTTTISIEKKIDHNSSSPLDVANHLGWPKMEKSLEVTMLRSMEDVGIASLLNGASVEDLRHATNRYLYLAIVHASVLGSRCKTEDVDTIAQLEEKVRSLEAENKHVLVKSEALAKEKEELAVSKANCATGKENDEALHRANTQIAELEKQLQDKEGLCGQPALRGH